MSKRRTKAADVANVTHAIARSRDPELEDLLAQGTTGASTSDSATAQSEALKEGIRLGFLLHDVSRMRRSAYDLFMRPLGITRAQWWVLAHLSRHDGMMQTQLAAVLEVGKASLGDVIESLERNGWVSRRPDPSDKRAKRVYLTKSAQGLIKRMTEMEHEFNSKILGDLSAKERQEMTRGLVLIKHAIARLDISTEGTPGKPD
tara:strand:+ start:2331 stop:2939 length:609 start_codon:yes stop_codon:yes gene_type:complete